MVVGDLGRNGRDEIPVSFCLFHIDTDLHFVRVGVSDLGNSPPDLQSTVDFTLLHQISPRYPCLSIIASFHKFCKIQFDVPKYYCLSSSTRRVLLQDLEVHLQVLQHAIAVYYQPKRQRLFVVPYDLVLSNDHLHGSPAMLGFV